MIKTHSMAKELDFVYYTKSFIARISTVFKIKLVTIVKGNPKVLFSIPTTPKRRGGRYSIRWINLLYSWSLFIILSVKQGGIKYHFCVFGMTRPGIEPQSSGPLTNTLLIRQTYYCRQLEKYNRHGHFLKTQDWYIFNWKSILKTN